jgi:glycosyltransferase involved in cell wall biosynthesis
VGIDATPLLGARTGVGRYVAGLVQGLGELAAPPDLVLTEFTLRRGPDRGSAVYGSHITRAPRRLPARLLHQAWMRSDWPPIEALTGRLDVFHGTNYVLPPLRRARGVLTVHDLSYERYPDTVSAASLTYRTLVPRGLRRANAVVVDSAAVGEEVVAQYAVPRELLVVAPLGVDPVWAATEAPTPDWLRSHGLPERYLLFVGNREPRKNLPVLLGAVRLMREDDPATPPLVLVGPPGWGPALDASRLPASAVVTTGYLGDADLRRVVAGAECLAFPSRYEGFGLPPLEALAAGTPVVVSDIAVLREVCGEHAAYAPVDDATALAASLRATLDAPPDPAPGRAHAATFTWRRCAELTMRAYTC